MADYIEVITDAQTGEVTQRVLTDAEIAALQPTAAQIRAQRNNLLDASDWTQVFDAPVDRAAWAIYRQALRDITIQAGFPANVIWPSKPE
jgi:hypothetical protein